MYRLRCQAQNGWPGGGGRGQISRRIDSGVIPDPCLSRETPPTEPKGPQPVSNSPKARPVRIAVIIPALDEEAAIGLVVREVPTDLASEVLVVDNWSTHGTAQ